MPDPLIPAEIDWTEDGAPVSRAYGDVYFSREDGLAESRAVFLAGCGLPEAWAGRAGFTVGELGFGTGLNILALLDLWSRTRPSEGRLNIWSVEAHPLTLNQLIAAHRAWPELAVWTARLQAQWPAPVPGLHRIDFPELNAALDLAFGDAVQQLGEWRGRADAWFLDGFAPAANPGMWSDQLLEQVAAHCAPGARLATFTVAGQVRRSLVSRGLTVDKRPGHGRKRERLEAVYPGKAAEVRMPGRIAVIGGGVAGASVTRAFRRLGLTVTLIEEVRLGAGASGAPAALVTPWIDAGLSSAAILSGQAFRRAVQLYQRETPRAVIAKGVARLARDRADFQRLMTVAEQPIWPAGSMTDLSLTACEAPSDGLWVAEGVVIEPLTVLEAWTASAERLAGRVVAIRPGAPVSLEMADGEILEFDAVVVAAGWGSVSLGVEVLRPVRGQLAWADGVDPGVPCIWGPGYVIPTRTGGLVGATHDRGRSDAGVDPDDTLTLIGKLGAIRPDLVEQMADRTLVGRAAVRAATPDHRPICGPLNEGVWTLTGLGGRGFSWAPLLAEHLAAMMIGAPSPISESHHALIAPHRRAIMRDQGDQS